MTGRWPALLCSASARRRASHQLPSYRDGRCACGGREVELMLFVKREEAEAWADAYEAFTPTNP